MMIKFKNIVILIIALAIAGVIIYEKPIEPVGASLTTEQKLESINATQALELSKGHYKHIPRTHIKDNDYRVDEYKTADGRVGYTVTLFKTINGIESSKVIDYGFQNRDRDWTHLTQTATTTP